MTTSQNFDSLLFDMDGTLWDAVDSYCAVWNRTIDDLALSMPHITRGQLERMMGVPLDGIFDALIGGRADFDVFMDRLTANEKVMMPSLGGVLYPGVRETIEELSHTHRLFMVSNCNADGLPVFLEFTGLKPFFSGSISFGETGKDKDENIRTIVERYSLEKPLYIGDTRGDCQCAHRAGVPFAWASYGFGTHVEGPDYVLGSISDLPAIS